MMNEKEKTRKTMRQLEMEMAIQSFTESLPIMIMYHSGLSEAVFSYYTSLVDAGFTEEQAFELVKVHGAFPPFSKEGN